MKLGINSPEITAPQAAELFRKARDFGFQQMQLNYSSVYDEEMPAIIPENRNRAIAVEATRHGIEIVTLSGTFNMAHPDPEIRQEGISRFEKIAASSRDLGCELVSICTGTRNIESMWTFHPDNESNEAWKDMRSVMEQLILIAEKYKLYLGIETEASNVVNTPEKAKKIIDELKSDRLKIILDAANLFQKGMAKRENVKSIISRGIDILAPWIALAHAKDIKEGEGLTFTGPGMGIIDFEFFLKELENINFKGGMILHGMKNEKDIPFCVEYFNKLIGKTT